MVTPDERPGGLAGSTQTPPGGSDPGSVQGGANRIEEIIEQAQQSARQFVDNAKRQAGLIVEEAQREARNKRADVIGDTRKRVDELTQTAEGMLRGVRELNTQLTEVVNSLRASSERLQAHVGELVGQEKASGDGPRHRLGGKR